MKKLNQFITEKLKISNKSNKNEIIDLDKIPKEYRDYIEDILPIDIEINKKEIHINKCIVEKNLDSIFYKFYSDQEFMFSCNKEGIDNLLKDKEGKVWGRTFDNRYTWYVNIKII